MLIFFEGATGLLCFDVICEVKASVDWSTDVKNCTWSFQENDGIKYGSECRGSSLLRRENETTDLSLSTTQPSTHRSHRRALHAVTQISRPMIDLWHALFTFLETQFIIVLAKPMFDNLPKTSLHNQIRNNQKAIQVSD